MEVTGAEIVGNVEKIVLVSFQVSHSGGESKNHFESIKQVLKKFTSGCESIDVYYPSDLAYLAEILPSEVKLDPAIDLNFVFGGQMPGEVLISLNF